MTPKVLGAKVHAHERLPSTNEEAKRLARAGAGHGEVVTAAVQTAGRGRRGRAWLSLPGEQLALSVILRLDLPPSEAPRLTSLFSVAVAEALASFGLDAKIKWPNDIEVGGGKVSGILTELSAVPERIHFIVLGIGVNLGGGTGELPEEVQARATTVEAALGERVGREEMSWRILGALEAWLDRYRVEGFEVVRERYEALSAIFGERVRMIELAGTVEGVAVGVDEEGALLVRTDEGEIVRFLTGDVTSLRRT